MRLVFRLFYVSLVIGVAGLATSGSASAQLLGDNSHIQLKHIFAAVQSKPGGFLTKVRPLTPILTVPKAEDVGVVCQRAPRAAEAILNYFAKNPAPLDRRRQVDTEALKKESPKIAAYVNRAYGKNLVSEVFIVEGGKSLGRGVMSRLPFAQTQGCGRVLEEYDKRLKELLGEGGKKE